MDVKSDIKTSKKEWSQYFNSIFKIDHIWAMNKKDVSLPQASLKLHLLFELLGHKETNYAFFGVSRIKVISKIIGTHSPLSRAHKNKRRAHPWTQKIRHHNRTLLWGKWTHRSSNTLTLRQNHSQILNLNIFNTFPFPTLFTLSLFILFLLYYFWAFSALFFKLPLFCPAFSFNLKELVT